MSPEIELILRGTGLTLLITGLAYVGALVVGVVTVAMRILPVPVLRSAAALYVEIGRNVPVLALLFLVVYGLPEIGIVIPLFWCGVLVLAAYEGAFASEGLRTGVLSVDRGTTEAARALGMTGTQNLRHVILPQAALNVIQPMGSVLIKTLLASSLVAVVGIRELTGAVERVNITNTSPTLFFMAGLIYVSLALIVTWLSGRAERRLRAVR